MVWNVVYSLDKYLLMSVQGGTELGARGMNNSIDMNDLPLCTRVAHAPR